MAGYEKSRGLFVLFISCALLVAFFAGCADIKAPTPGYILERPIGTDSVKVGMTKDRVKEIWGDPDQIDLVKDSKKWESSREAWTYNARSSLPVTAGYLSRTKIVYFDGAFVTNIAEKK